MLRILLLSATSCCRVAMPEGRVREVRALSEHTRVVMFLHELMGSDLRALPAQLSISSLELLDR